MKATILPKLSALALPFIFAGCATTTGNFVKQETAAQPQAVPTKPARQAGLVVDDTCRAEILDRSRAGEIFDKAKANVTNLDKTCVGIVVGQLSVGTKDKIDPKKPSGQAFARLSLPACEGSNVVGSILGKVGGYFDKETERSTEGKKQACDTETGAVMAQLSKAANDSKAAYIKTNGIKAPALNSVFVQVVGAKDLSSYQLPGFVTNATQNITSTVTDAPSRILDGAKNTAGNAANGAVNRAVNQGTTSIMQGILHGIGVK